MATVLQQVIERARTGLREREPQSDLCVACGGRKVTLTEEEVLFEKGAFGSAFIPLGDLEFQRKLPSVECSFKEGCLIIGLLAVKKAD